MSDFDIEEYMARFVAIMMAKESPWPSSSKTSPSGLSEGQRRSLACVAGHIVYEQLNTKRRGSATIEIADNGDIKIS